MTIRDDANYADIFGAEVIDEVHSAFQATGECQSCGTPLGDGDLRVGLHQVDDHAAFLPRHTTCAPPPELPSHVFAVTPVSHLYSTIGISVEHPVKRPWPRRPAYESLMIPTMVLNPCTDRVDVRRDAQGTWNGPLAPYRDLGFVDFGLAGIGAQVVDPAIANVTTTPTGLEVRIYEGRYQLEGGAVLQEMATAVGGLMAAVSVRVRAGELAAGSAAPLYDVVRSNPADVQTTFLAYN